jgi:hypothetical protein
MAGYADVGVDMGRVLAARRPTRWGERAFSGTVGGLLVALGFAAFSGGAPRGSAGVTGELRELAVAARLSPDEERTVRSALEDARASWSAGVAYFDALEEEDPGAAAAPGIVQPAHFDELTALIHDVVAARLAGQLDERRLRAVESYLDVRPADLMPLARGR